MLEVSETTFFEEPNLGDDGIDGVEEPDMLVCQSNVNEKNRDGKNGEKCKPNER